MNKQINDNYHINQRVICNNEIGKIVTPTICKKSFIGEKNEVPTL